MINVAFLITFVLSKLCYLTYMCGMGAVPSEGKSGDLWSQSSQKKMEIEAYDSDGLILYWLSGSNFSTSLFFKDKLI